MSGPDAAPGAGDPSDAEHRHAEHRNGGAAVVETLAAHGVEVVFGIPGTHNLELYRHLARCGIRPVTTRHEQGAGYAADGYGLVSGRPGVVITTSGPGVLNAVTAAATAWAESRPLLLVSPGPSLALAGRELGELHETKDSSGALARVVGWSRRVGSPEEAAEAVADAFTAFATGRPRPVHLEVPVDVLEAAWTGAVPAPRPAAALAPAPDAVARAAALMGGARRPVLLCGGGSRGAAAEVRALAEHLGAVVVTTCNGKGVLPEDHPLSAGAGVRLAAVQEHLAASDGLLVVGSELGDAELWGGTVTARALVRLDVSAEQLQKNAAADVELLADARLGLRALLAALEDAGPPGSAVRGAGATGAPHDAGAPHTAGAAGAASDVTTASAADDGTYGSDGHGLAGVHGTAGIERAAALRVASGRESLAEAGDLARLNEVLREVLPAGTTVAGDSSQVTYLGTVHHFPVADPTEFLYAPGFATLGYGLPAAIGAAVARPDRHAVALVGDGALVFALQELLTAVELQLPLVVVVADSGGYREILEQQERRGIPPVGVDLHVPDFPALARACGAAGVSARLPGGAGPLAPEDVPDLPGLSTLLGLGPVTPAGVEGSSGPRGSHGSGPDARTDLADAVRAALARPGPTLVHLST